MDTPNGIVPMTTPALQPPEGVTPNFVNPENFHTAIIGTIVVCIALTTCLACTRMYTKLIITKTYGWDDCMFTW